MALDGGMFVRCVYIEQALFCSRFSYALAGTKIKSH